MIDPGSHKRKLLIFSFLLLIANFLDGQNKPFVIRPEQLEDLHFAEWIAPREDYGVFYFRKQIEIQTVPQQFIIHVSADARYRLYVNGEQVSWGPAVGDVENWNYETVDIAPFLKPGENIIASQVWNWGSLNGARQQTVHTAFILQGNSSTEQIANSNKTWKVSKDKGYFPLLINNTTIGGGYIAGATDSVDTRKQPFGWEQLKFDDSKWTNALSLGKGNHSGLDTWKGTAWKLKAREIPQMEQKNEPIGKLLKIKGISSPEMKNGKLHLYIPTSSHVELLLDNHVLTIGFPQLLISGGKNATIKIQYQESLYNQNGKKENRNEWENKYMKGYYDVFIADGHRQTLQPLWIRTFRYIKITIDTQAFSLTIDDLYNKFTAYPFIQKGNFECSNDTITQIQKASWRTARLCALETYMDCPYYEQLQYIGDTRIQALISMYVTGDDRLARNAIQQLYASMQPMGLSKSAHPTNSIQIIPPFSLLYIGMLHDYYMLRDDKAFVKQFIPGMKFILEWFINKIDSSGMLGPLPYWNHIDGGTGFINGSPPGISDGGSANVSLLLAYTLDLSAEMLTEFGYSCDADRYRETASSLKKKTFEYCFSKERGLIAETPSLQVFSQHTNIFGILTDTFSPDEQKSIMHRILNDKSLIKSTLYFKFYLFQAMKKVGMGGEILSQMSEWKSFLDYGLSTFPEHGVNSRSDCHAWAAHPLYDLLSITCGVEPASPGFKTVKIQPEPGSLSEINGKIIHPMGVITVHYKKEKNKLSADISLPDKLTGTLFMNNQIFFLSGGENHY